MSNGTYTRASIIGCLLLSLGSAACNRKNLSPFPSVSEKAKSEMHSPVNCASAEEDIALLESERASVAKQILSGVRSVFPIAAAAGVLMGDYRDRVSVATGKYNHDLEIKIEQIKTTCGIK